jgi:hypothetical protein
MCALYLELALMRLALRKINLDSDQSSLSGAGFFKFILISAFMQIADDIIIILCI